MRHMKIRRNKSQVALEITVIFVAVFLFVLAIIRIGVWGNAQMVGKTVMYNNTREEAGTPGVNRAHWPVYINQELSVKF